jgi:hypothetical protein
MATLLPSRDPSSLVLPSTVTAQDSPQVCMNPTCAILPERVEIYPENIPGSGNGIIVLSPRIYCIP